MTSVAVEVAVAEVIKRRAVSRYPFVTALALRFARLGSHFVVSCFSLAIVCLVQIADLK